MSYGNEGDVFWGQEGDPQQNLNSYYNNDVDYANMQGQQLDFQSFTNDDKTSMYYNQPQGDKQYMEPYPAGQYPEMFTPNFSDMNHPTEEYDEPPLLEELEIYPDRILEKTLAALNPFRSHSLADDAEFLVKETDLAGPITFCLMLACCLFVSGNKAPFGYIYGLSVVSCMMMYMLLTLMTLSEGVFTMTSVASIVGYCLLPIVGLSVFGVFVTLHNSFGTAFALLAVIWSSLSASRLFVAMSGDHEQRPLIGYPCALVYGVFALLVVF